MPQQNTFIRLFIFLVFACVAHTSHSQNIVKRYLDHTLKDTSDPANPKFIAYPTIAYSPETNFEFGLSGLYVYRANRDTVNRLS